MSCTYFDAAVPGTGPMGMVGPPAQNVEVAKYNDSYNLSLRSRSDYNLNPQPEGFVTAGFPKSETNREGMYAIETDRGELSATAYTQVNASGQKTFQNRLQDTVKPTMKETTIYAYDGTIAPITVQQSLYSQFLPTYATIKGKQVRIGGASNYGLKSATEYSYFAGPTTTGINGGVIQNPDARLGKNTKPVPDFNVDGPGTLYGAIPDGAKFQNYRLISQPVSNGLRFNYNLETQSDIPKFKKKSKENFRSVPGQNGQVKTEWDGKSVHNYSQLLGKNVQGIENRYTSSYQIAPLLTNPLDIVWDPTNKGEIPPFYGDSSPPDYAYMNMKPLPADTWIGPGGSTIPGAKSNFTNIQNGGGGYNKVWEYNPEKNSSNAYILGIDKGIHNDRIEWKQGVNTAAGVIYNRQNAESNALPSKAYGGNGSIFDQYLQNEKLPFYDGMYTTLGDPLAGWIGQSVH